MVPHFRDHYRESLQLLNPKRQEGNQFQNLEKDLYGKGCLMRAVTCNRTTVKPQGLTEHRALDSECASHVLSG